jgi:chromosome partitioning protein
MQTLLIGNQKGGVGKSALATQFALYAAARGLRVLAIDLDHQGNLSTPLLRNALFVRAGDTASLLREELPAAWTPPAAASPDTDITASEHKPPLPARCAVFVASAELTTLERNAASHNLYATLLRHACIHHFAPYFDVCVLDVNPNPDIRFGAAMIAANHFLVPIQLNQEAIDGVKSVLDHPRFGYARIKAGFNPDLQLLGMLPNLFEGTPFQKANLVAIMRSYGGYLFKLDDEPDSKHFACIPTRTAVAEAQASGSFIGAGKKTSHRDAWKQLQPVFAAIARKMGLDAPPSLQEATAPQPSAIETTPLQPTAPTASAASAVARTAREWAIEGEA